MAPTTQARIPKTMLTMISLTPVEDDIGRDEVGGVGSGRSDVLPAVARIITMKGAMNVIGCLVITECEAARLEIYGVDEDLMNTNFSHGNHVDIFTMGTTTSRSSCNTFLIQANCQARQAVLTALILRPH